MKLSNAIFFGFLSQLFFFKPSNAKNLNTQLPELPVDHLIRYLNTFPQLKQNCIHNEICKLTANVSITVSDNNSNLCWGHERGCKPDMRFQTPECPGEHTGWAHDKATQVDTFYHQADFGYVKDQIRDLNLICTPQYITDSSLECTPYLRFCRGRNLLFDLRDLLEREELIRYHTDVLKPGQILGHCELNKTQLKAEMDHMGALQSWAPELRNFDEIPMPVISSDVCDVTVTKPTFILKIDAPYNMYHHFCDFFNLYASLFVNQSHTSSFDLDTQILIWETYPYDSPFADTLKAFSRNTIWTLNEVKGKRVCFRNVVLPLLPRMIFGLFYNTPLVHGCQNSGLFRAFSEFILHRLKIPYYKPYTDTKLRVTFLSRKTKYRKVLNEDDLIDELSRNGSYYVRRISFERSLDFTEQLAITRNTDILIGMHGAGLTHLLFLPNWATIFELYNCEDPNCYKDLARLRGVNYITWEDAELVFPQDEGHHPKFGAHAKFTNYEFDPREFVRLVDKAAEAVKTHKDFQRFQELRTKDVVIKDEL